MEIKPYHRKENNNKFTLEEGIKLLKYLGYTLQMVKKDFIINL
jgi:hypothetical protein